VHTGHNLFKDLNLQDSELVTLMVNYGVEFAPDRDMGMTTEETKFRNPHQFYKDVMCALLRNNAPANVQPLRKLTTKCRGEERHLMNKLSVRYNKYKQLAAETL
jgi:hypothetical protein